MIKNTGGFASRLEGESVVVSLTGEIDHHNAAALRTGIDKLIYEKRPGKLVLDLEKVTFMDSSGIALILRAQQRMQMLEGSVVVRSVPQQARRVLDAAGIGRLVCIK